MNTMIELNTLKPAYGSTRPSKRLGRGVGSGTGKTAGRGHNGAGSRVGGAHKPYFEGGQTSLIRRIPKRGFTNIFKKIFQIVNIEDIEKIDSQGKDIGAEILFENGLIRSMSAPIKILGNGDLTKSIVIRAQAFSKSAREKIEKAKGKAEVVSRASA
jgi:large subunit ribosomal protein L15